MKFYDEKRFGEREMDGLYVVISPAIISKILIDAYDRCLLDRSLETGEARSIC